MKTNAVFTKAPVAALLIGALCASAPAFAQSAARQCISDNPAQRASLIVWDWNNLVKTKAALSAGAGDLKPAYDRLIKDADKAMSLPPQSVTFKLKTPPSGDKADYMSIGPYWWPNPGTENGLPYIRRDGEVNPERYDDSFDNARLANFSMSVQALAMAGYFSGDKAYAEKGAALVKTWFVDPKTRMNPNLDYAQAVPGKSAGRSFGIIDSYALVRLADSIGLLEHAGALSSADMQALRRWYSAYSVWLLTSENGKKQRLAVNNHGVYFDAQLAVFSVFAGEPAAVDVIAKGVMKRRIPGQITKKGTLPHELDRTRPFHYSNYTLQAYYDISDAAECRGLDLWNFSTKRGQGLRKATDFLAGYSNRMNIWPYKELKTVKFKGFYENLLRAEAAYGEPDYRQKTRPYRDKHISDRVNLLYPG